MKQIAFAVAMAVVLSLGNARVGASVTCPGDISDNTQAGENFDVNVFDLLLLLSGWANDAPGAEIAEPFDVVDVFDLLGLLQNWGPCVFVPGDVCEWDKLGASHCQLTDLTGQGSTGVYATSSDPLHGFIAADDFRLDAPGVLTSICWYGLYWDFRSDNCNPEDVTDDFTVKIYTGFGGLPASSPFFEHSIGAMTLNVEKVYTGDVIFNGSITLGVFEYTYEIPPNQQIMLNQEQCYWLEISNTVVGDCNWLWVTAPPGDGFAMQRSAANPMYQSSDFEGYDLAWCLNLGPIDLTQTLLGGCEDFACDSAIPFCPVYCFEIVDGYFQSPSNFNTAFTSDADVQGSLGTAVVVVDNFVVDGSGQSISAICWIGIFLTFDAGFSACVSEPPTSSPFKITYYPDNGSGAPNIANPLATFHGVEPSARADTGLHFLGPVWEFTYSHAPVPVADGATIWLEIQHVGDEACVFLWLDSPDAADSIAYQDIGAGYNPINSDLAFKVDVDAVAPPPLPSP